MTVDDDPTGIRWINFDLIGLKWKMKNIKKQKPIQRRNFKFGVLYFGLPNQPFSGTMGVYTGRDFFICNDCGILRNTGNTLN